MQPLQTKKKLKLLRKSRKHNETKKKKKKESQTRPNRFNAFKADFRKAALAVGRVLPGRAISPALRALITLRLPSARTRVGAQRGSRALVNVHIMDFRDSSLECGGWRDTFSAGIRSKASVRTGSRARES